MPAPKQPDACRNVSKSGPCVEQEWKKHRVTMILGVVMAIIILVMWGAVNEFFHLGYNVSSNELFEFAVFLMVAMVLVAVISIIYFSFRRH